MIEYDFTKKNFKYYLKLRRRLSNIIFILLGTIIYFYITYYLIFLSPLEVLIFYALYLLIFGIIILLFNELYCYINIKKNNIYGHYKIDIKNDKIIVNINNNTYEYLNTNIKKIIKNKKYILIRYNNHLSLLFINKLIDNNNILNNIC